MTSDPVVKPGAEKRRSRRYGVPIVITLDAGERKDRVGVALDVSVNGARFNTASRFKEGDPVTITLLHSSKESGVRLEAHIVRVERAPMKSDLLWNYVTAVKFERPAPEIEPTLLRACG
jgi:hypothetical protein